MSRNPDPVKIIVGAEPDGREFARLGWRGVQHVAKSRHGAVMALARELVAAGMPDAPWRVIGPREKGREGLRFYGRSLHRLAGLTIWEEDHHGLRVRPFENRPVLRPGTPPDGANEEAELREAA